MRATAGAASTGARLNGDEVRSLVEWSGDWYTDMLGYEVNYLALDAKDEDGYPLDQHFDEIISFLEQCRKERRKVLVHCVMGINRSASAVVAFLCGSMGVDL